MASQDLSADDQGAFIMSTLHWSRECLSTDAKILEGRFRQPGLRQVSKASPFVLDLSALDPTNVWVVVDKFNITLRDFELICGVHASDLTRCSDAQQPVVDERIVQGALKFEGGYCSIRRDFFTQQCQYLAQLQSPSVYRSLLDTKHTVRARRVFFNWDGVPYGCEEFVHKWSQLYSDAVRSHPLTAHVARHLQNGFSIKIPCMSAECRKTLVADRGGEYFVADFWQLKEMYAASYGPAALQLPLRLPFEVVFMLTVLLPPGSNDYPWVALRKRMSSFEMSQ